MLYRECIPYVRKEKGKELTGLKVIHPLDLKSPSQLKLKFHLETLLHS
jgi:hypothetical protein